MGSGIYAAAPGAIAQNDAMNVTANNIANASTTAYKADRVSFGEALGNAKSADRSYAQVAETAVDTTDGPLQQTDNPLDLALVGDGYFAVDTPNGVRYTRAGNFRLDADNRIVTAEGFTVRGTDGRPIQVPDQVASLAVRETGEVFADGNPVGQLELARFDANDVRREGAGLFAANGRPLQGEPPQVLAGTLESSNVNIVRGMVDLVRVSRTYESLMRMIQGYSDIESRAARDLGGPK